MKLITATLLAFTLVPFGAIAQPAELRGDCDPPTAQFTSTAEDPAKICLGDVISVNASTSTPAPGRSIEQWIWNFGPSGVDTSAIPFAILAFDMPGVHLLTLEVIDDLGCSSGPTTPVPVLVSATPEFTLTELPATMCDGQVFPLSASAVQPPMISTPDACSSPNNGTPLIDSPTPTVSTFLVTGQPDGVITNLSELGDVCIELEHSYMGDLVLTVTCPNGQSATLHQQGGGGTFLGDANDSDGQGQIVAGTCFQYCFGANPEFGTLAASAATGTTPNTIQVSQGNAVAPGRYTSVQPLEQLIGCPFNGEWSFASADMLGADNGYLCGWCVGFGAGIDSSFIDQGPILGTSSDSSFWTGNNVVNTPGQPGSAEYTASVGLQTISYTVIDSYGCEHEVGFDVFTGSLPEVTIVDNPDLGLVCAEVTGGPVSYQWSFQGQVVVGAAGACFTPPGVGLVSVHVENAAGCFDEDTLLNTAIAETRGQSTFSVYPVPNGGDFSLMLGRVEASNAMVRITDMAGRVVHVRSLGAVHGSQVFPISIDVAVGTYFVELTAAGKRSVQRIVVR